MFYTISKLFIVLLYPCLWIFILLVICFLLKNPKTKKRLLIITIILFFLFSNNYLQYKFAKAWDITTYPPNSSKYNCAILLGGFASDDGDGNWYFNAAADRFIQGVELKSQNRVKFLLVSSGAAQNPNPKFKEADYVGTELKQLHFPDSAILIENRSRNTVENAQYSKILLQERHIAPPYLLVTSAFHMRRAIYTFKKAGLDVVPYPCDYIAGKEGDSLGDKLIPNAGTLYRWNIYFKEIVGMLAYHFKSA